MFEFEFQNPTRIVFGKNSMAKLDSLIPREARVLILYGGESALRNGTIAEIREALGNRECQEFSGIEANPTYETLMLAVERVQAQKLDYLLAVGGGSVIDGTKFVAAAVAYDGDPWEIVMSRGTSVKSALPFGTVLTLSAAGSEMNQLSVITRMSTHTKRTFRSPHVYPRFSILDPAKTRTVPVRQLANGIADSFTHVIEQYLTYPVNSPVQDRLAEGLMQAILDIGPTVMSDPADDEARANLSWACTLALNGLISAGVPMDWSTHMISYEITSNFDVEHARAVAIVLPSNLRVRRDEKRAKLLQYAERVWKIFQGSDDERINQAIQRTESFYEGLGLGTRLSNYSIGADAIDGLVAQLEKHGMTALGENGTVTLDVSRRILEGAL